MAQLIALNDHLVNYDFMVIELLGQDTCRDPSTPCF